jgi:HSP20 family protein
MKGGNAMIGTLVKREPRSLSSWLRPRSAFRELEEMLADFVGTEPEAWFTGQMVPSLDLSETDAAVEVRMDLPGIKPADIDIQINGNLLTVSGERKEEKEEKGKTFHRVERRSGSFSRSVTLPCAVLEAKVDAKYDKGVLSISMPKAEEAKAHRIPVKT